ncbi:MAG: AAA-associated domain-containing protein [Syntrophomonas sp.]
MPKVRIEFLPKGDSKKARDNAKGHLLEQLISQYLKNRGYENIQLDQKINGTEWDVQGNAALSNAPLLVSCKCLSTSVSPEPIKALGFDVQNLSFDNPTVAGILIAIPKISSDSNTYWKSINPQLKSRIRIIEEALLIEELSKQNSWKSPDTVRELVEHIYHYETGDMRLLYSDIGAFWVQFIKERDANFPNSYLLLDTSGELIEDKNVLEQLDFLLKLNESDIKDLQIINEQIKTSVKKDLDNIVPLAHLSTCGKGWFDYKYPAPADFFAGRSDEIYQFLNFVQDIKNNRTASRVCIITGTSGIGKSSFILKLKDEVIKYGGFLISINCISARGKIFTVSSMLRLINELNNHDSEIENIVHTIKLQGIDSLAEAIVRLSHELEKCKITPIMIFDQFETALLDGPLSEKLVELVLQIEEERANIIFGFAWKTDLWWPDDHVPYTARENLRRTALPIRIEQFGPSETNILLNALNKEINMSLLPELRKEIQLFSRGFPWLLKKVCWHIAEQIRRGIKQEDILDRKLDLRTLFETDLVMLDEEEKEILKKLAAFMPADTITLGEAFSDINLHNYLNKFVDMRLIIKQGQTYTIYHDIFKEFLRTGRVPIEESYLLKMSPNKALEVFQTIAESINYIDVDILAKQTNMKVSSLYNYVRDLDALGIASIRKGKAFISDEMEQLQTTEELLRDIRRRLLRNTCIKEILKITKDRKEIELNEIVQILKKEFPAAPLQEKTWDNYAKSMVKWLRFIGEFDLNVININNESSKSTRLVGPITNAEYPNSVISGLIKFIELYKIKDKFKKSEISQDLGLNKKTVEKFFIDARLLGFAERLIDGSWRLTNLGLSFLNADQDGRKAIVAKQIKNIQHFNDYLDYIMKEPGKHPRDIMNELMRIRGKELTQSTLRTINMVTRNWLNYAELL